MFYVENCWNELIVLLLRNDCFALKK